MLKAAELIIMKKEGGIDLIGTELQMWYSESTEVRCLRLKWVRKMMPQSMGIQPAFFWFSYFMPFSLQIQRHVSLLTLSLNQKLWMKKKSHGRSKDRFVFIISCAEKQNISTLMFRFPSRFQCGICPCKSVVNYSYVLQKGIAPMKDNLTFSQISKDYHELSEISVRMRE